ncbi:cell wall-binding repeat-containing protein [Herbiconiux sp. CPCC 205763]|uniref:Cell wall-binding repeat-containing protein n=1 Tax=Herbiconiux aconitum TaxID=2970913 RepID=A0ABT2GQ68_9MICO|nr:cell wall-binding repeat-containing protein [Herbiconiux aconitum]MCS5718376.1 cell wall-binding repeat-containing protein [Herbiconiux aconitum]
MTKSTLAKPLTGLLGALLAMGLVAGGAVGTAAADEPAAPPAPSDAATHASAAPSDPATHASAATDPASPDPSDGESADPATDVAGSSGAPSTSVPHDFELYLAAGSVASFRAGDIISDANMYNGLAMSIGQVQAFLTQNVPACDNGNCIDIKVFSANAAQPANADCTKSVPAGLTSAAAIIATVGDACGVSQKALLALIQKESSLIGNSAPGNDIYDHATFYGCDDTGSGCNSAYKGFFKQVYNAAQDLKNSQLHPPAAFPVGQSTDIDYNPNPGCGSAPVVIRTVATAALYDYTPYQPNPEAKVPGSDGNGCSSLGNLNFWFVYTDWFGYPHIDVDRIQGADRFAVAVAIAEQAYPSGTKTVYLATGTGYADALSAGPAAVQDDAPLLLTLPDALPTAVSDEITKLKAEAVVIVGGPNSVSSAIESQLRNSGLKVDRIGGADRFEVSRNVAQHAFANGASGAYVATGLNFPDALSASGAGGHNGMPVVLVNGTLSSVDGDTSALLKTLKVKNVTIAGGPNSVSSGIASTIATQTGASVSRQSGADRFEASLNINKAAYGTSDRVFLATGLNFPDALAGSALAGAKGAPLIVVPGNCVPANVKASFKFFDNTRVTLLGGPNSLSDGVFRLTNC